jgi:hypothetical protein
MDDHSTSQMVQRLSEIATKRKLTSERVFEQTEGLIPAPK